MKVIELIRAYGQILLIHAFELIDSKHSYSKGYQQKILKTELVLFYTFFILFPVMNTTCLRLKSCNFRSWLQMISIVSKKSESKRMCFKRNLFHNVLKHYRTTAVQSQTQNAYRNKILGQNLKPNDLMMWWIAQFEVQLKFRLKFINSFVFRSRKCQRDETHLF